MIDQITALKLVQTISMVIFVMNMTVLAFQNYSEVQLAAYIITGMLMIGAMGALINSMWM